MKIYATNASFEQWLIFHHHIILQKKFQKVRCPRFFFRYLNSDHYQFHILKWQQAKYVFHFVKPVFNKTCDVTKRKKSVFKTRWVTDLTTAIKISLNLSITFPTHFSCISGLLIPLDNEPIPDNTFFIKILTKKYNIKLRSRIIINMFFSF